MILHVPDHHTLLDTVDRIVLRVSDLNEIEARDTIESVEMHVCMAFRGTLPPVALVVLSMMRDWTIGAILEACRQSKDILAQRQSVSVQSDLPKARRWS